MKKLIMGLLFCISSIAYSDEREEIIAHFKLMVPEVKSFKEIKCEGETAARYLNVNYGQDGFSISIDAYSAHGNDGSARFSLSADAFYMQVTEYHLSENTLSVKMENYNDDIMTTSSESQYYTLSIIKAGKDTTIEIINNKGWLSIFTHEGEQHCTYRFE